MSGAALNLEYDNTVILGLVSYSLEKHCIMKERKFLIISMKNAFPFNEGYYHLNPENDLIIHRTYLCSVKFMQIHSAGKDH